MGAAGVVRGVSALAGMESVAPSESDDGVSARHSSESAEHFSPYELVAAVVEAFGGNIDLDPASCARANEYIEATHFFDIEANGLLRDWFGRTLLNPPGGKCDEQGRPVHSRSKHREGCSVTGSCGLPPGHKHKGVTSSPKFWWRKLMREWMAGHLTSAIFVGFSVEQLVTIQEPNLIVPVDCVMCIPDHRFDYLKEDESGNLVEGGQPPHGSFVAYLGDEVTAFEKAFKPLGRVLVGHHDPVSTFYPGWRNGKPKMTAEEERAAYEAICKEGFEGTLDDYRQYVAAHHGHDD